MAELPVVDIYKDPGIWICMDEGCNSNCHGEGWAINAQKKFEKIAHYNPVDPYQMKWIHQRSRCFDGIGNAKVYTHGKRMLPVCMKLINSGYLLPTTLESHEQEGWHPLLLSDKSQGCLGMIKDMRTGRVYLQDYDDYLPIYRAAGSGLKVICISHFPKAANPKY